MITLIIKPFTIWVEGEIGFLYYKQWLINVIDIMNDAKMSYAAENDLSGEESLKMVRIRQDIKGSQNIQYLV